MTNNILAILTIMEPHSTFVLTRGKGTLDQTWDKVKEISDFAVYRSNAYTGSDVALIVSNGDKMRNDFSAELFGAHFGLEPCDFRR